MAQSRLEKIGTIFTRVSGLLRSGAIKPEDKPIWYDVYAAFPPKLEPRFDRPATSIPIRNIFYEEDIVRAKYHKSVKHPEIITIADVKRKTQTQQFIKIYNDLKAQGALDHEKIFETANDMLAEQRQKLLSETTEAGDSEIPDISSDYQRQGKNISEEKAPTAGSNINIQNLFKD